MALVRVEQRSGAVLLTQTAPILSVELLQDLATTLNELAREANPLPLVLATDHPRIFLAGAHLSEISELDPSTCRPYARGGRRVCKRLATYPTATVAAVHGPCSGGGFDLALSCDAVVAGPRARFSHPGVRRGLVTGWGGTVLLPAVLDRPRARRALVEGASLSATELETTVRLRQAAGDLLPEALDEARWLHSLHASRLRLWRALRHGRFIDRFRAFVVLNYGKQ